MGYVKRFGLLFKFRKIRGGRVDVMAVEAVYGKLPQQVKDEPPSASVSQLSAAESFRWVMNGRNAAQVFWSFIMH